MYAARQVLKVDLVNNADARGNNLKSIERLHAPFQELVALAVTREFELHIEIERVLVAIAIDLHRVVYNQVNRHQRLYHLGIPAHFLRHAAHCSKIRQQRHAGKILQHNTRHHEGDFIGARCGRQPVSELLDVLFSHFLAVHVTQHRFEHNAD